VAIRDNTLSILVQVLQDDELTREEEGQLMAHLDVFTVEEQVVDASVIVEFDRHDQGSRRFPQFDVDVEAGLKNQGVLGVGQVVVALQEVCANSDVRLLIDQGDNIGVATYLAEEITGIGFVIVGHVVLRDLRDQRIQVGALGKVPRISMAAQDTKSQAANILMAPGADVSEWTLESVEQEVVGVFDRRDRKQREEVRERRAVLQVPKSAARVSKFIQIGNKVSQWRGDARVGGARLAKRSSQNADGGKTLLKRSLRDDLDVACDLLLQKLL
jgi:hypothetical protein